MKGRTMARTKKMARASPLADIAASNLDRAASEIDGTIAALANVDSTRSEVAREHLAEALRLLSEARELAIETFEQDF